MKPIIYSFIFVAGLCLFSANAAANNPLKITQNTNLRHDVDRANRWVKLSEGNKESIEVCTFGLTLPGILEIELYIKLHVDLYGKSITTMPMQKNAIGDYVKSVFMEFKEKQQVQKFIDFLMEGMKAKAQLDATPNGVIDVFKASNNLDIALKVENEVVVLTWLLDLKSMGKTELTTMFDVNQMINCYKRAANYL